MSVTCTSNISNLISDWMLNLQHNLNSHNTHISKYQKKNFFPWKAMHNAVTYNFSPSFCGM